MMSVATANGKKKHQNIYFSAVFVKRRHKVARPKHTKTISLNSGVNNYGPRLQLRLSSLKIMMLKCGISLFMVLVCKKICASIMSAFYRSVFRRKQYFVCIDVSLAALIRLLRLMGMVAEAFGVFWKWFTSQMKNNHSFKVYQFHLIV